MQAGEIYKITNKVNNKIYIGKTIKTLDQRLKEHICTAKRWKYEDAHKIKHPYNSRLYPAMNIYGYDNFYIELVELVGEDKTLEEAEQYWIKQFNATDDTIGYNISEGGLGGPLFKGHKHTKETKQKLSELSREHIKLDQASVKQRKLPCTRKFQNLHTGEILYATEFSYSPNMHKENGIPYKFCKYHNKYFISLGMRREELPQLTLSQCKECLDKIKLYETYIHECSLAKLHQGCKENWTVHKEELSKQIKDRQQARAANYWESFMKENNINPNEYKKLYYKYQKNCPNKHLELIFKIGYTQVRGLNKYLGLFGGGSGHKNGKISIEKNN